MKRNDFGEYIRLYREKNKLTQQQLADILEITMNYYGRLERGENTPGISLLLRTSDKLNVSIDVLLGSESEYISKQSANEYVERIFSGINEELLDALCEGMGKLIENIDRMMEDEVSKE